MLCVGKGFSAGFAPMSALLTTSEIAQVFRKPGHDFRHGHTFSGHPVSAAAIMAVLDIFEREDLVARAAQMGAYLRTTLETLYRHSIVGDVRGLGMVQAVELVADRETRARLGGDLDVGGFIRDFAWRNGMILRNNGDILVLAPPFVITREQIDEVVGVIDAAIVAAMERFGLGE